MSNKTIFNNVVEDMEWRGLLFDHTPEATHNLITEKITCYNGFDPTASSLHIGNLVAIMGLARLQRYGHTPIILVGGGTGMIGDPSGKSEERILLSKEKIDENVDAIYKQVSPFLDFSSKIKNPAKIVNNSDWLRKINLLSFLRDIGKHFTVNTMLSRESVKNRLDRDTGISFTEFSYQLLQAYDFLKLYDDYGCNFQSGGSDQWGNILGGIDLIRRVHSRKKSKNDLAHGIIFPLVTTSSGEKFGKSIGGAPTLDPEATSPYKLFQFFLNVSDEDIINYLKIFTFITPENLLKIQESVSIEPQKRFGQKTLAEEVTKYVHGTNGLLKAKKITEAFFSNNLNTLSLEELEDLLDKSEIFEINYEDLLNKNFIDICINDKFKIFSSKSELRRLCEQGGIYLNDKKFTKYENRISAGDLMENKYLLIRKGKKNYFLLKIKN
ncbi:MAG: tyrosine--tRNA ligase [Chloroflexi bacterium]|nr:tyrosine--tRNA ligase [Chloroflexota bacterium]|tara:strand:+ start:16178 stop:17494 length:1317 start_codon:yes stop_codon:yes gene_type:complete